MRNASLLLLVLMLIRSSLSAQSQVYIDVLGGHNGLTSEFFFLEPIDKQGKWTAVSRSEMHLPAYVSTHPTFVNYTIFAYNFKNHFGLTAGTYASSQYPFSARLGLQYLKEDPTWLIFANLSSAVTNNPDAQLLVVMGYLPQISPTWRLVTRLEARTAVNYNHGHQFSAQQFKLGAQHNEKIGFGVGIELEERNQEEPAESGVNLGPFLRINF